MRKITAFVACGVALGSLIGCGSKARAPVVRLDQLRSAGYLKYWEASLPLESGDRVKDAFLVDENLYVTTHGGELFTIEAKDGLLRWARDIAEPGFTIFRPAHLRFADGQGPLVVVTTTRTYFFDRQTGDVLQTFVPTFAPGSGAVGTEKLLFMGGTDGEVHCLLWKHPFGPIPIKRWNLVAGGPVRSTPSLFGPDSLIFASQGGFVASCGASDKSYEWSHRTEQAVIADPVVDETGVYVASTDRSLYKFDPYTGRQLWRHRFPSPLQDSPAVTRGICYQICENVGLVALDAQTGELKWTRADGVSFVAARADEAAILTRDGRVCLVDPSSGQTLRGFATDGMVSVLPNTRDDRVLLLSPDGRIVCARPDTVPYLRRQQVLAASRRLDLPAGAGQEPQPAPLPAAPRTRAETDPFRSPRDY